MNYLKLKQKIYEAIERNPLDRSAYEEMFAVCREYEKIDFQTAHAWNHELRNRISWGLRMTVCSQKFDEAREFDDTVKMRQKHCEEKRKRTGLFSQMINSKFSITMLKTAVMVDQMLISSVRRKLCQQTGFLKNFSGEKRNGAT